MKKRTYVLSLGAGLLALGATACSDGPNDFTISSHVRRELAEKNVAGTIEVVTVGRVVTLSGTVPDTDTRAKAEDIAEDVSGVTRVVNNLRSATAADAPAVPPAANIPNPIAPGAKPQPPDVR